LKPLRLDRSRQAAAQVLEHLREAIMSLELEPGAVLSRAALADEFGVSQTPIRDALLRLGEEGLVDIFPQHATLVSRIDVSEAQQAHFLRRSIECEIARVLAGAANEALLARLRAQIDMQVALMGDSSLRAFIDADRAFHRLMYEAAGVPDLYQLVLRRSGHVDRLRLLHLPTRGKQQAIVRDHRRIVSAIADRDADAAQAAVRDHLSGTLSQLDAIRKSHPAYLT
jgi:DNA-binding GntR family transcriptional regulator